MQLRLLSLLTVFLTFGCTVRSRNESMNTGVLVPISGSQKIYPKAKPAFLSQCGSQMTQDQYAELLKVSDLDTFKDYREAAPRSQRAAEIFAQAKDRRGIFASMYVEITHESVGSSYRKEYQDSVKASELVKRFADRYFGPLHNYLLNGSFEFNDPSKQKYPVVSEWTEYYKLSETCGASDLRILGTGVNCHMTYDLPMALMEIDAPLTFKNDFMKFGDILIQKKRQSTNLLISQQNVYAASFFDLFLFGEIVDQFMPVGTAATWGFQLIRAEAWSNGIGLQNKLTRKAKELGIRDAWNNRQAVLALMPHSDKSMKGTEEK
jgi:hypothetical protein